MEESPAEGERAHPVVEVTEMRWTWTGLRLLVVLVALAGAVAPAVQATAQPRVTVEESVTTDPQGNRVVTERTFVDGVLVKVEVKVITPQGQLLSKVEEVFQNGQLVNRQTVTVSGGVTTKLEQTFEGGRLVEEEREVLNDRGETVHKVETEFDATGQVVKMEERLLVVQDGQRVEIRREFRLRDGVLVLVKEQRRVVSGGSGSAGRGSDESGSARKDDDDDDDRDDDDRDDDDHDDDRRGSNSGSH
jgi:hypothetical protein